MMVNGPTVRRDRKKKKKKKRSVMFLKLHSNLYIGLLLKTPAPPQNS